MSLSGTRFESETENTANDGIDVEDAHYHGCALQLNLCFEPWYVGCSLRMGPSLEDAEVIEKFLTRLGRKAAEPEARGQPLCRTPLQRWLLNERG